MAELDEKYEAFYRKWKPRLGLKDMEIAQAFMRGEANDAAGYGELPSDPGRTEISIRVDGRGLDASADPCAIDDMIAEWQEQVDPFAEKDCCEFTKHFIAKIVATNRHLDPGGELILSAAVWLASGNAEVLAALQEGGVGLLCEFTYDDVRRERRMRMLLVDQEEASE